MSPTMILAADSSTASFVVQDVTAANVLPYAVTLDVDFSKLEVDILSRADRREQVGRRGAGYLVPIRRPDPARPIEFHARSNPIRRGRRPRSYCRGLRLAN